ncbi:VOC family protein [Thermithiobacillus plumbiphilus]|uniref:VOC family protein n=1 Tax=Thermithiobacillus plumbiphilus TaxID=1729899 RepID=A0ABU9D5I0_9PROT
MNTSEHAGRALRLSYIGLNVADLSQSAKFYEKALGFMPDDAITASDPQQDALLGSPSLNLRMRLGNQAIELTQFLKPGNPYPADSSAADLWFQHFAIVTQDIEAAYARVQGQGAAPITQGGPQQLPPSSGGVTAYKFRDPDGHPLELLAFPENGNAPATRGAINHTAISVASIEGSLAFYRDWLGFSLGAQQLNQGPQQEHLDALTDVAVEVVALNPVTVSTPHVELLAYQWPRGRALAGRHANDIAATRMRVQVDSLSALFKKSLPRPALLGRNACAALVADPDGHLSLLEESA